jgi:hypothetical protein
MGGVAYVIEIERCDGGNAPLFINPERREALRFWDEPGEGFVLGAVKRGRRRLVPG